MDGGVCEPLEEDGVALLLSLSISADRKTSGLACTRKGIGDGLEDIAGEVCRGRCGGDTRVRLLSFGSTSMGLSGRFKDMGVGECTGISRSRPGDGGEAGEAGEGG